MFSEDFDLGLRCVSPGYHISGFQPADSELEAQGIRGKFLPDSASPGRKRLTRRRYKGRWAPKSLADRAGFAAAHGLNARTIARTDARRASLAGGRSVWRQESLKRSFAQLHASESTAPRTVLVLPTF